MVDQKTYQTEEQIKLRNALEKRRIKVVPEFNDNHKHVDLFLPDFKIDIEIDGLHHLTKAEQIVSDFHREYYSGKEGRYTLHIPNIVIKKCVNQIADAIAGATILLRLEKSIK